MISIIIPTYNEADQIDETIRRIFAFKGKDETEIIVVDAEAPIKLLISQKNPVR